MTNEERQMLEDRQAELEKEISKLETELEEVRDLLNHPQKYHQARYEG